MLLLFNNFEDLNVPSKSKKNTQKTHQSRENINMKSKATNNKALTEWHNLLKAMQQH